MKKIRRATLRRLKPKSAVEEDVEETEPVFDTQVMSSSMRLVSFNTLKREGKADQHLFKLLNEKLGSSSRTLGTTQSSRSSRFFRRQREDDDTSSQERAYGGRRSTLKELGEEDETFLVRLANSNSTLNRLTGQVSLSIKMAMTRMFAQPEKFVEDGKDGDLSGKEEQEEREEDDDDVVLYEGEDGEEERVTL